MTTAHEYHPFAGGSLTALEGVVVESCPYDTDQEQVLASGEPIELLYSTDAAVEAIGSTHEELGGFLQRFVDLVNSGVRESTYVDFKGFSPSRAYTFKDETGTHDAYALLKSNYSVCTHCDPEAEQWWTLVSFETGDTLDFADSHPRRIAEQREYTSQRSGHQFVAPERIAKMAGIKEHPFGSDDPVVEMLAASNTTGTGIFRPVTLRNRDQMERFGAIVSLGHPATEHAKVSLSFDDPAAMFEYFGEHGAEWLLKATDDIDVPATPVPVVTDSYDGLRTVLSRIGTWGPVRRNFLLNLIEYVDVRGVEDWARPGSIQSLMRSSVKFDNAGGYEVTTDAILARKILCDQWDFVAGIYRAADGMYGEGGKLDLDAPRTINFQSSRLDENRARVYSEVFGDVLMPVVEQARVDLHIPTDISETEQVMCLFTKHPLLEKALRIVRDEHVMAQRPDMTVPQWARACEVLDHVRFERQETKDLQDDGRAVLKGYGLDVERIARLLQTAPGMSSEQVLRSAYRHLPTLDRARTS